MKRNYKISPKKTSYGQYLFKSVLEARWAIFFDCLGVIYEYEPNCFEVETGCRNVVYKPDFFLPELEKYIEIKPTKPFEIESIKAAAWSKHIGDTIILFNLAPPSVDTENGWRFSCEDPNSVPMLSKEFCWGECPKCGFIDIVEFGDITTCGCLSQDYFDRMYDKDIDISNIFQRSERLEKAYRMARGFRFQKTGNDRVEKLNIPPSLFDNIIPN